MNFHASNALGTKIVYSIFSYLEGSIFYYLISNEEPIFYYLISCYICDIKKLDKKLYYLNLKEAPF